MKLEGDILRINEKPYRSRRGPGIVYSFLLVTDTNVEQWVTFGFDKEPPFAEGDRVSVEVVDKNGYLNYVEGSGRIIAVPPKPASGGSAPVPVQQPTPSSNGPVQAAGKTPELSVGAAARLEKEDRKQLAITWQHSQEMAIAKVGLLLQHDGLPMTAAKTKAALAQRYAEISAAIDKETVKAYNDVLTLRVLQTVADAGVVDTSAPDTIPPAQKPAEKTNTGADDYG